MWKPFVLLLSISLFAGHTSVYASAITIKPQIPVGIFGETLEIRVDVNDYPFKSCSFWNEYYNNTIDKSHQTAELSYWEDDKKAACKLSIISMDNKWKGVWNITIEDKNNNRNVTVISLGMIEPVTYQTNVTETKEVGSSFMKVPCFSNQKYGRVFNPKGNLVSEGDKAGITLPFVRIEDAGVWRCLVQMSDRLSEIEILITLNVTSTNAVETFVQETDTEVNLLCHHGSVSAENVPCLFQLPNGQSLAPREGIPIMNRYEYFGDNVNYDCGISIKKPLLEEEKGIWKCMMASPKYASLLKVGSDFNPTAEINYNSSTRTPNVTIVLSDTFQRQLTIQCFYPNALTYCYARSPAGRIYSAITGTDSNSQIASYTGMGLNQGDCQITIDGDHLWKNESGAWLCGMGVEGIDDIQVEINVHISDNHFRAEMDNPNVDTGDNVKIMCRSVMGYGLRYCRFNHPTGKSLNLGYHSSSVENRFSYIGKGLEAGECGLMIEKFRAEDFGTWTCAAVLIGNDWLTEFQDTITMSRAPMSLSSMLGLSVTLGVLGIVGAGGLVFWQLRRRKRGTPLLQSISVRNTGNGNFVDIESDDISNSHSS